MHANVVSMNDFRLKTGRHIGGSAKHDYDDIIYKSLAGLSPDAIKAAQNHFRKNYNAGCDPQSCVKVTTNLFRMRSRRGGFDPRPAA